MQIGIASSVAMLSFATAHEDFADVHKGTGNMFKIACCHLILFKLYILCFLYIWVQNKLFLFG